MQANCCQIIQPEFGQPFHHAHGLDFRCADLMRIKPFQDLIADRRQRIQRRQEILRGRRDIVAADAAICSHCFFIPGYNRIFHLKVICSAT